ncbi:MAG: hypothetical protein QM747_03010 [Nocardioides sp.]
MTDSATRVFWRATAAGILAAVVSLAPTSFARADAGCSGTSPCVIVDVVGGASTFSHEFSYSDIDTIAGDEGQGYVTFGVRNAIGSTGNVTAHDALPVRALLAHVPLPGGGMLDPRSVTYASVPEPADPGEQSVLSAADLESPPPPGDFQGDLMPSVFTLSGTYLNYIRPLRSTSDVNADESISTAGSAQAITITVHTTGEPLNVVLSATPTALDAQESATFSAHTTGSGATGEISYHWQFVNRTRRTSASAGTTATTENSWKQPGTYYVVVSAHDKATGSYGSSAPVLVQVGPKPPKGGGQSPGGGHHHRHHHPPSGPVKGHGHQNHGHQHGTDHQHQGQSSRAPSSPRGANDGQSKPGHDQQQSPPGPTTHVDPATPGGTSVTGVLLSGAQVYSTSEPNRAVPRISAAAPRPRDDWSVPWRIAAGIGVPLLLVALGMTGEALQLRRRVARMSA